MNDRTNNVMQTAGQPEPVFPLLPTPPPGMPTPTFPSLPPAPMPMDDPAFPPLPPAPPALDPLPPLPVLPALSPDCQEPVRIVDVANIVGLSAAEKTSPWSIATAKNYILGGEKTDTACIKGLAHGINRHFKRQNLPMRVVIDDYHNRRIRG